LVERCRNSETTTRCEQFAVPILDMKCTREPQRRNCCSAWWDCCLNY